MSWAASWQVPFSGSFSYTLLLQSCRLPAHEMTCGVRPTARKGGTGRSIKGEWATHPARCGVRPGASDIRGLPGSGQQIVVKSNNVCKSRSVLRFPATDPSRPPAPISGMVPANGAPLPIAGSWAAEGARDWHERCFELSRAPRGGARARPARRHNTGGRNSQRSC